MLRKSNMVGLRPTGLNRRYTCLDGSSCALMSNGQVYYSNAVGLSSGGFIGVGSGVGILPRPRLIKNVEPAVQCKEVDAASNKNNYQSHNLSPEFSCVNILVKKATNIPKGILRYSVKVAVNKSAFDGKTEKQTSYIMVFEEPIWNQRLTFIIKECDLLEKSKIQLDCSLCCTDKNMNAEQRIDLESLTNSKCLQFKKKLEDKYIQVGVEVTITRCTDENTGVRFSQEPRLCNKEREFVTKRTSFVFKKLRKNLKLFFFETDDVPNIAIIGSGGGMRAVIGMSGAITALDDIGILDCAMYMAGVSGSAWYLTTLYAFDKELNPKAVNDSLRRKVKKSFFNRLRQAWYNWKCYTKSKSFSHGKYFTTTDAFGEMIGAYLLGKKCKQKWSDQRKKLKNGCAPLPLLSALQIKTAINQDVNEWVEFSPYEVSIPTRGVSINMKEFGEKFYGGFVTKEYGEQPIHYLQGVCGSGYAKALDPKKSNGPLYKCLGIIKDLLFSLFNKSKEKIVAQVPNWLHGITTIAPNTNESAPTTENEEVLDGKKEEMMLVDAGIEFNSPYPTILHPDRKVDLILSFDFSYRDGGRKSPFEELIKAKTWAEKRGVPFPKIETEDKKEPYEELYIFDGEDKAPTILHFVMTNNKFRDDEEFKNHDELVNFDIFPDYHTLRFSYSELEFDRLKSLIEYNVWIKEEDIRTQVDIAIRRKSKKRLQSEPKISYGRNMFAYI